MKKLTGYLVAFLFLAQWCFALSINTNRETLYVDQAVTPAYDAFTWEWSGFDDEYIKVDFDVPFTNVGFRLSYPKRGTVYLDLILTSQIDVLSTYVVTEVLEVVTQKYDAIVQTNTSYGWTNKTATETIFIDYYTNAITDPVFVTNVTSNGSASATYTTNALPTNIVYYGTGQWSSIPAYGLISNVFNAATDQTTFTTDRVQLVVYSSNVVLNGTFQDGSNSWTFPTPSMQPTIAGAGGKAYATNIANGMKVYQAFDNIASGKTYRIYMQVLATDPNTWQSTVTTKFAGVTSSVQTEGYWYITNTALTTAGLEIELWNTTNIGFLDNIVVQEYVASNNLTASATITNRVQPASNKVFYAYPGYQHENENYSYTSNDVWRVTASIIRTSLPPVNTYYAEFLAWESGYTNAPTRTLAQGTVLRYQSGFENTNNSTWTNPLAGSVIGPPTHTLTPVTSWPFLIQPSGVYGIGVPAPTNFWSNSFILATSDNGTTTYAKADAATYVETDPIWTNAQAVGFAMGGDIDMGINNVTNVDVVSVSAISARSLGDLNISATSGDIELTSDVVKVWSGINVNGDLTPTTSNDYDLGSATKPWQSLHIATSLYYNGMNVTIEPDGIIYVSGTGFTNFFTTGFPLYVYSTLNAQSDVDSVAAPTANQVLLWNDGGWSNAANNASLVTNMNDVADCTSAAAPTTDHVMTWDGNNWSNAVTAVSDPLTLTNGLTISQVTNDNALVIGSSGSNILIGAGTTTAADFGTAIGINANGNDGGLAVGPFAIGNNEGVMIGRSGNGSDSGVAIGWTAAAAGFGVAVGREAVGTTAGSAVGYKSSATISGAAVGREANGDTSGAAIGLEANGYNTGVAVGKNANAWEAGVSLGIFSTGHLYGVAIGREALGGWTNIAIGYQANALGSGVGTSSFNRIAIGQKIVNEVDESIALRGDLYLDGATNIFYRPTFGTGTWIPMVETPPPHMTWYYDSPGVDAVASNEYVRLTNWLEKFDYKMASDEVAGTTVIARDGIYDCYVGVSWIGAAGGPVYEVNIQTNGTEVHHVEFNRKTSSTDNGNASASAYIYCTNGEIVSVAFKTDKTALTVFSIGKGQLKIGYYGPLP